MKQVIEKEKPTIHPNEVILVTGGKKKLLETDVLADLELEVFYEEDHKLRQRKSAALTAQYCRQAEVIQS